jgi:hypothetical protein
MQKRAGILFLSINSGRVFLIWENKWTVPTFIRNRGVIEDAQELLSSYNLTDAKFVPIELYTSKDSGFEYSTYVVLVEDDFACPTGTYSWSNLDNLPKNVHIGLKNTLSNKITQVKIETILATGKSYDID